MAGGFHQKKGGIRRRGEHQKVSKKFKFPNLRLPIPHIFIVFPRITSSHWAEFCPNIIYQMVPSTNAKNCCLGNNL
jgi:hypothetical protein